MTCAVKSDKYLVDVRSDAFHQAITFGNFGTVGHEINPRPNTITDILRFVLVPVNGEYVPVEISKVYDAILAQDEEWNKLYRDQSQTEE